MNKALYVFCEGRTEQSFCRQVLQPTFFPHHDGEVRAGSMTSTLPRREATIARAKKNHPAARTRRGRTRGNPFNLLNQNSGNVRSEEAASDNGCVKVQAAQN